MSSNQSNPTSQDTTTENKKNTEEQSSNSAAKTDGVAEPSIKQEIQSTVPATTQPSNTNDPTATAEVQKTPQETTATSVIVETTPVAKSEASEQQPQETVPVIVLPQGVPVQIIQQPVMPAEQPQQQQPQVQPQVPPNEGAIKFLESVRNRYSGQETYQQFLSLMKGVNKNPIDTRVLTEKVKTLFADAPDLIEGFQKFLPSEDRKPDEEQNAELLQQQQQQQQVQIQLQQQQQQQLLQMQQAQLQQAQLQQAQLQQVQMQQQQQLLLQQQAAMLPPEAMTAEDGGVVIVNGQAVRVLHIPPFTTIVPMTQPFSLLPQTQQQPVSVAIPSVSSPQAKTAEVDQARQYIKKIKERFRDETDRYKTFLGILHGYHKEHNTIDEVFSKVKELFHDHPDLLEQFKMFLPEPSNDQQQQQLQQQQFQQVDQFQQLQQQQLQQQQQMKFPQSLPRKKGSGRKKSVPDDSVANANAQTVLDSQQTFAQRPAVAEGKKNKNQQRMDQLDVNSVPTPAREASEAAFSAVFKQSGAPEQQQDEALFRRLRRGMDPLKYRDLLCCMKWFGQGIITKSELLHAAYFILGSPETYSLFLGFKRCVLSMQPDYSTWNNTQTQQNELRFFGDDGTFTSQASMAMRSRNLPNVDLATCPRIGSSYYQLPSNMPPSSCTGRSAEDSRVLNDSVVCSSVEAITAGRMNNRAMPTNPLVNGISGGNGSDQLVDFDVAISQHRAALRTLFSLMRLSKQKTSEEKSAGESKAKPVEIDSITRSVVMQLYASQGPHVLEMLAAQPEVIAPVIIARIQQRTAEFLWWKSSTESSLQSSQDQDKQKQDLEDDGELSANTLISQIFDPPHQMPQYVVMNDRSIHRDIFRLLAFRCEPDTSAPFPSSCFLPESLRVPLQEFFRFFILPFFGLSRKRSAAPPAPATAAADAVETSIPSSTFFASMGFAILFQLYRMLYELLSAAKQLLPHGSSCGSASSNMYFFTTSSLWLQRFELLCANANIDFNSTATDGSIPQSQYYRRFLCACVARRMELLDEDHFNHELETLFGGQAASFSPVVRIVAALARETEGILTSECCKNLIRMFRPDMSEEEYPSVKDAVQREVGLEAQLFRVCHGPEGFVIVPEASTIFESLRDSDDSDNEHKDNENGASVPDVTINVEDRRRTLHFHQFEPFEVDVVGSVSGRGNDNGNNTTNSTETAIMLRRSRMTTATRQHNDTLSGTKARFDCTLGLCEQVDSDNNRLSFVSGTEDTMHWSSVTDESSTDMQF